MTAEQLELYKEHNNLLLRILAEIQETSEEFCCMYCHDLLYIMKYIKEEETDKPDLQSEAIKCMNSIELINSKFKEHYNYEEDNTESERFQRLEDLMRLAGSRSENEPSYYEMNIDSEMIVLELFNKLKKYLTNEMMALELLSKKFDVIKNFARESMKIPEFVEDCVNGKYPHEVDEFAGLSQLCDRRARKVRCIKIMLEVALEHTTTKQINDTFCAFEEMVRLMDNNIEIIRKH